MNTTTKFDKTAKPGTVKIAEIKVIREEDTDADLSYLEMEDKEYAEQNRKRLKAYNNGHWWMVGIRVEAEIMIYREGYATTQTINSGGLWGIESDSDETYFKEVAREQIEELKSDLKALNVDLSNFEELAEEALNEL